MIQKVYFFTDYIPLRVFYHSLPFDAINFKKTEIRGDQRKFDLKLFPKIFYRSNIFLSLQIHRRKKL